MSFAYHLCLGGSLDTETRYTRFRLPSTPWLKRKTQNQWDDSKRENARSGEKSAHGPPDPTFVKIRAYPEGGRVVRQGPSHVKICGFPGSRFFGRARWVELGETDLALYAGNGSTKRSRIPLCDIEKLERTTLVPYGLSVQTKGGKCYLFRFQSDDELYGWQDDIALRSMGISLPYNCTHHHHAAFDSVTKEFKGLPAGWDEFLPPKSARAFTIIDNIDELLEVIETHTQDTWEIEMQKPTPTHARALSFPPPSSELAFLLRVNLDISPEACGMVSTHVAVSRSMELRSILERVCRAHKLHPADYALALPGCSLPLAQNSTIGALQGRRQLVLIKRVYTAAEETPLHVYLRISPDDIYFGSVSVTPNTRLFDVRRLICSQKRIMPDTYHLARPGTAEPLSMELLVWDLDGENDLVLLKK